MEKILLLKLCILINLIILFISTIFLFFSNKESSNYFQIGWSENFTFVSIEINTPERYFTLCLFIISLNISEIFLNDIAGPLIQFSTYNPYKNEIKDFTRFELELYSNIIIFIQLCKRFIQIFVILSQIDIALISLVSSQVSASFVIHYLLNQKYFGNRHNYIEISDYPPINI